MQTIILPGIYLKQTSIPSDTCTNSCFLNVSWQAVINSPITNSSNEQADGLYFKNDPRVPCYLRSGDKKAGKTKIPGTFALNKFENIGLKMQSTADRAVLKTNVHRQDIPVRACSGSSTVDMNNVTHKFRVPKVGNFGVDKGISLSMLRKAISEDARITDSEISYAHRFSCHDATLSKSIPDVTYSNSPIVKIKYYSRGREDIDDPSWYKYQSSNGESDEFRFIRQMWRRNPEEKLTRNLTVETYRSNRLQHDKTEWVSGKRKRKAEQDLGFLFEQPPAKIPKRTRPSTFLQDKEIEEKNYELRQIVSELKKTTMCALDFLQKEYELNFKKLTDHFRLLDSCKRRDFLRIRERLQKDKLLLGQRTKEKIYTVIENFQKQYYQVFHSMKQEQNKIEKIKAEIEKYDSFCGNKEETKLTEEEMKEFILIDEIIKNNRIFYAK